MIQFKLCSLRVLGKGPVILNICGTKGQLRQKLPIGEKGFIAIQNTEEGSFGFISVFRFVYCLFRRSSH